MLQYPMIQKLLITGAVMLLITGIILIFRNNFLSIPQVNEGNFSPSNKTQEGIVAAALNIQTKTLKEDNIASKYTLDIQYPEITGFKDSNIEKSVNEKIAKIVTDQVREFKKSAAETGSFVQDNNFMSGLDIRYEIAQANENIFSLSLQVSNFAAGAAHPSNYNLTFNYQPSSQSEEITLSDLFKADSNYLEILSRISREDLNNQFKNESELKEFINSGTEPLEENFKNFILKPSELVLVFDPYQVAPYAAGTRTVSISKDKIKDILNPNIRF